MAFITISHQSRHILVAKPESLADHLRMAKKIFKPVSHDVHLAIDFTDSNGNKAKLELHESSYWVLKDGDATFLIDASKKDKSEAEKKREEKNKADLKNAREASRRTQALLAKMRAAEQKNNITAYLFALLVVLVLLPLWENREEIYRWMMGLFVGEN